MELKKPGSKYLQDKDKKQKVEEEPVVADEKPKKAKKAKKAKPERKSALMIVVWVVLGLAVVSGATFGVFHFFIKESSNEAKLLSDLERLGRDFYEGYYHEQVSDALDEEKLKNFFSGHSNNGITVNLNNLERYPSKTLDTKSIVEGFINSRTDEKCDDKASKVTIYPESPYGKTNYRIEATLVCGFADQ